MPSFCCLHPTCTNYLPEKGYCQDHAREGKRQRNYYDRHLRNRESKAFYNSANWERARLQKLASNPVCERCERVFAEHVHHVIPVEDCTPDQKTDQTNLMSLCQPCHNAIEKGQK